ncbi:hypothetical protein GUH10_30210, partial [Xanthomonas citri pv. citri]|nr:hypothetical protein [Xanthomonas citri pv. citri]
TVVPDPITAPALVGRLRRVLEAGDETDAADGATPRAAAAGLAVLAADGVGVADPRRWWGLLPLSTEAALVDPEREVVALSPSRVETALRNPL